MLVDLLSLVGRASTATSTESLTTSHLTHVGRRRPDSGFGHPDDMSVEIRWRAAFDINEYSIATVFKLSACSPTRLVTPRQPLVACSENTVYLTSGGWIGHYGATVGHRKDRSVPGFRSCETARVVPRHYRSGGGENGRCGHFRRSRSTLPLDS